MIQKKRVLSSFFAMFVLIILCVNVSAITAKIGNAKMIITAEEGDLIDRTILVINDNDVAVDIEVFASGDLEDEIELVDSSFTLQPGETKDARFKVELKEKGYYENRINVKFSPIGSGNGAALSSVVIIKTEGATSNPDEGDSNSISDLLPSLDDKDNSLVLILGASTILLVVVFGVLLYLVNVKEKKQIKDTKKEKKEVKDVKENIDEE